MTPETPIIETDRAVSVIPPFLCFLLCLPPRLNPSLQVPGVYLTPGSHRQPITMLLFFFILLLTIVRFGRSVSQGCLVRERSLLT